MPRLSKAVSPRRSLRYAAELARHYKAELTVLSVVENGEDSGYVPARLCEWIPEDSREHCRLTEIVRHGGVTEQTPQAAAELPADLIVIGVSRGYFNDHTLGESTSEILRSAACPVITVPGSER